MLAERLHVVKPVVEGERAAMPNSFSQAEQLLWSMLHITCRTALMREPKEPGARSLEHVSATTAGSDNLYGVLDLQCSVLTCSLRS